MFRCLGCDDWHYVRVNDDGSKEASTWGWNKSFELPTFTPSVLVTGTEHNIRCHSFVKDGKIQYLSDCTHKLKGQTVELPDVERD